MPRRTPRTFTLDVARHRPLLLAIENVKLFPTHTKAFGVALFSEFTWSPTYGFGVVFLLGLLALFRARFLWHGADRLLAPPAPADSVLAGACGLTSPTVSAD